MQLIDATSFRAPMRKSLGDKRREIAPEKAAELLAIHREFQEGEFCRIFPTTHFGYRKITVERPLRLNFQASPERIARLEEERAFRNPAVSKRKGKAKEKEEADGRTLQQAIRENARQAPVCALRGAPGVP